jgi:hypothetical protein
VSLVCGTNFNSRLKPQPGPGVVAEDEQLGQNRSDNTPIIASQPISPVSCASVCTDQKDSRDQGIPMHTEGTDDHSAEGEYSHYFPKHPNRAARPCLVHARPDQMLPAD